MKVETSDDTIHIEAYIPVPSMRSVGHSYRHAAHRQLVGRSREAGREARRYTSGDLVGWQSPGRRGNQPRERSGNYTFCTLKKATVDTQVRRLD
jgi:hypothetical protein